MKQMLIALTILLMFGTSAFGDDLQNQLSGMSEAVITSTREIVGAGVETGNAVAMTRQMQQSRFNDRQMLQVHETIKTAFQEGLPSEPLVNKAFEGIAKSVAADRVVQAMEEVRSRYSYAYQQAKAITDDEGRQRALGNTIAEGLAAGIHAPDMSRTMDRVRERARDLKAEELDNLAIQAAQTVRNMARLDVSSDSATDLVCQALKNQFTAREMEQMRNTFASEARYGQAEKIAQNYSALISAGGRSGSLGNVGKTGQDGRSMGSGTGGKSGSGGGSGGGGGGGR